MNDKTITLLNRLLSYLVIPGAILYFFLMDMQIVGKHYWLIGLAAAMFVANIVLNAIYRTKYNPDYHYDVSRTYTKVLTGFVIVELLVSSGLFE
ncbi:MAG: hypothetical protein Q4B70_01940 [Lachnospiraceae bacterium]|nr:hypothetical protein [Lachnospiraceae bacterium]